MASKILTIVPMLILSGLFFKADIAKAGILFLALAALVTWQYFKVTPTEAQGQEDALEMKTRSGPGPGPGGVGPA